MPAAGFQNPGELNILQSHMGVMFGVRLFLATMSLPGPSYLQYSIIIRIYLQYHIVYYSIQLL